MSGAGGTERRVDGTGLVLRWEQGGDAPVLVERTEPVDPARSPALRSAAARFRDVRSPHLLRPRSVLTGPEQTVVVLDAGPVRSLSSLVARRGSLEPGEVVTVGVALARALTAAHSDDLLLGGLSSSQVLLRDDGMPVLVVGAAALQASAEPSDLGVGRAGDVGALAELCRSLLSPQAPAALVDVLDRAADLDLDRRPDAVVLGALLSRACPPAPVRRTVADADPVLPGRSAERGGTAWGPQLPARALLVLAALVVTAAVLGWRSGGGGEASPLVSGPGLASSRGLASPSPSLSSSAPGAGSGSGSGSGSEVDSASASAPAATPAPVSSASSSAPGSAPAPRTGAGPVSASDWSVVLDRLDATRAAAFAAADEDTLVGVYAPAAAGLVQDRARVRALAAAGRTAQGVRHSIREVEVLSAASDRVRLRVRDVLEAYEVREAGGAVVGTAPGRGEAVSVVELRRTSAGWRVVDLVRSG